MMPMCPEYEDFKKIDARIDEIDVKTGLSLGPRLKY